jgi:hypothetical protein
MTTKFLASVREVGLLQGFGLPPKITALYRADFDDKGYVSSQYQLDAALQLWLPTQAVADFVYLGEGNLEYVNRAEIEAYFGSVFSDWAETYRPGRIALARQLDDLTEENPSLVYDFYFAQWSKSAHDCAYFQVQLDSPDLASWWIEFSSDRFNSPHLTAKQRDAIDGAGFDEPVFAQIATEDLSGDMLHYSPNHHKYMSSASADQVVDLIRGVLIQGFDALGFGGLDDIAKA